MCLGACTCILCTHILLTHTHTHTHTHDHVIWIHGLGGWVGWVLSSDTRTHTHAHPIQTMPAGLERLHTLTLSSCKYFMERGLVHLAHVSGSLEHLDLSHCRCITNDGLPSLYVLKCVFLVTGLAVLCTKLTTFYIAMGHGLPEVEMTWTFSTIFLRCISTCNKYNSIQVSDHYGVCGCVATPFSLFYRRLKTLNLAGTRCRGDSIQKLRTAISHCSVHN